jgi:geranylgeranyl pyrophosphate synthase
VSMIQPWCTTSCSTAPTSGDQVADALERVAATGALETARALAEDYAAQARAALDGEPDRASLEALTHAVVNRQN